MQDPQDHSHQHEHAHDHPHDHSGEHQHQHEQQQRCGQGQRGQGGGFRAEDRIANSARQWRRAFDDALHELRVELIKKEIRALWGAQLEATAKGAADAMREDWKRYWSEHKEELEPELSDPEARVRDVIRSEIKKGLG